MCTLFTYKKVPVHSACTAIKTPAKVPQNDKNNFPTDLMVHSDNHDIRKMHQLLQIGYPL